MRGRLRLAAAIGLFAALPAQAGDAVLVLDVPREIAGLQQDEARLQAIRSSEPPRLDLVFGTASGAVVPVTVPKEGLLAQGEASAEVSQDRYPRYELVAPATGSYDTAASTLSLDAQIAVTWSAGSKPKVYEVTLTAVPATAGELEVTVQGWVAGADSGDEKPAFSAVLSGALR